MILLLICLLQWQATQIQLLDNKMKNIGYIAYTKDVAYIYVVGTSPETFKIDYLDTSSQIRTILFISNTQCRGAVIITSLTIEVDLFFKDKTRVYHKFNRH